MSSFEGLEMDVLYRAKYHTHAHAHWLALDVGKYAN